MGVNKYVQSEPKWSEESKRSKWRMVESFSFSGTQAQNLWSTSTPYGSVYGHVDACAVTNGK